MNNIVMENMSGVANGVYILPKPSPGSATKTGVLGDKNGRNSAKKYTGKTPPLKPPKKHRSPDDDTEILRCKRRIQFAGRFPVQQRNPKQMAKRNERERNRVQTINATFEMLQSYLPPGYIQPKPKNKKMSKVEVLHAAINYIRNLQQLLNDTDHMSGLHPAHHSMQQPQMIPHPHGQLMMVTTAATPTMMTSSQQQQHIDIPPPLQAYQTSPVVIDAAYYNNNNNNNNSLSLNNNNNHHHHHTSPDTHFASIPPTAAITVQTCSPNSSYSPTGSTHSFDAVQTPTPHTYGLDVANNTASPTYGEAPLTPEDEDIIMEWLHDQKNMDS